MEWRKHLKDFWKRLSIPATLAFFTITSCGVYDSDPIRALLFHDGDERENAELEQYEHDAAEAKADLERALITPDRDAASAFIRSAIGYLR